MTCCLSTSKIFVELLRGLWTFKALLQSWQQHSPVYIVLPTYIWLFLYLNASRWSLFHICLLPPGNPTRTHRDQANSLYTIVKRIRMAAQVSCFTIQGLQPLQDTFVDWLHHCGVTSLFKLNKKKCVLLFASRGSFMAQPTYPRIHLMQMSGMYLVILKMNCLTINIKCAPELGRSLWLSTCWVSYYKRQIHIVQEIKKKCVRN